MSYKNESTFPNNCASLPILVKVFTKSFYKDYTCYDLECLHVHLANSSILWNCIIEIVSVHLLGLMGKSCYRSHLWMIDFHEKIGPERQVGIIKKSG